MANAITVTRILLIPFVALLAMSGSGTARIAGAALYGVAAGTDWLDGYVARSGRGRVTELGKVLDPLADRLLITTVVIILYLEGLLPLWILALIAARELAGVAVYQILTARGRRPVINYFGKVTTALILIGISIVLVGSAFQWTVLARGGVYWLMLAGTAHVFSGLSYLTRGRS